MTPERWNKLDALFHEALALEGEARAAYLAQVCGDDEPLCAEAERLLAAHEREGSFIDAPILAGPTVEVRTASGTSSGLTKSSACLGEAEWARSIRPATPGLTAP